MMQVADVMTLAASTGWMSAQMGEGWTPAMVLDRLLAQGASHVWVQLPPGWAVLRQGSKESTSLPRRMMLRVVDGDGLLEQCAMFGDLSIAVGVPDELVDEEGGARYRSVAPIPVAMLRLAVEDLNRLATRAGGKPVPTFLRRAASLRQAAAGRPSSSPSDPDARGE